MENERVIHGVHESAREGSSEKAAGQMENERVVHEVNESAREGRCEKVGLMENERVIHEEHECTSKGRSEEAAEQVENGRVIQEVHEGAREGSSVKEAEPRESEGVRNEVHDCAREGSSEKAGEQMGSERVICDQKHLVVLYTNADGMSGKISDIKERISEANADIVGITETKLVKEVENGTVFPSGYTVARKEREERYGGGVALLVKDGLKFEVVNLQLSCNFEEYVVGYVSVGKSGIVVVVIYNPPRNENRPEVYEVSNKGTIEVINKASQLAHERQGRIMILGDFNHKEIDWEALEVHGEEGSWRARFLDCVQGNFLHQHVLEPTRARGTDTPSVLDLVFTQSNLDIGSIEYGPPVGTSDHCVLKLNFVVEDYLPEVLSDERKERLNYYKGDYKGLNELFLNTNWGQVLGGKPLQQMYESFCGVYKRGVDDCVPVTRIGFAKGKEKWFNQQCSTAKENRDKSWKKYRRRKSQEAWEQYKMVRNTYVRVRREAEKQYEQDIANKAKTNPKLFHGFIRSKLRVKHQVLNLLKSNGDETENDEQICEELNKEFQSVFTVETTPPPNVDQPVGLEQVLDNVSISVAEVEKLLKELDPHKAVGPDGISPFVLKECAASLAQPITLIFERSLELGELPGEWKTADVVPIFKKGRRDVALNYRPVSLTSIVCKVLEKVLRKRISDHLDKMGFVNECQHGFRKGKSTVTNLIEFYDRVSSILQERDGWVDCIFLDFQKAFDTVPHERLIAKLEKMAGVRGKVLNWIRAYLENRTQRVKVRNSVSACREVTSGVPQGSVLGPLLFLIYINDLPKGILALINMFADDAKVAMRVLTEDCCRALQRELDSLQQWADKWLMKFNPTKCTVMRMGVSKKRPNFEYSLAGVTLGESQAERDLGIMIEPNLSPEKHINSIVGSVYALLANIKVAFRHMDSAMFREIYVTYVRPKLEYAVAFWNPHLKKHIGKLERVQRHATKLVPELQGVGYEDRLKELDLPLLEKRRERGDMITTFKFLHGYDKIDSAQLFDRGGERTRGHSWKLRKRTTVQDVKKFFFSSRVVDKWNSLDEDMVSATSIHSFKQKYDRVHMRRTVN